MSNLATFVVLQILSPKTDYEADIFTKNKINLTIENDARSKPFSTPSKPKTEKSHIAFVSLKCFSERLMRFGAI